jgi:hypothetical protein
MAVRTFGQQKAALSRAERTMGDRAAKVLAECKRTVAEWNSQEWADAHHVRRGAWPDDWARWQRALDDSVQWPNTQGRLEDL